MLATEHKPLKVLNQSLSQRLRDVNSAVRALHGMGLRLLRIDPMANRLELAPEDARRLLDAVRCEGFRRNASAGSTRYECQYQGVTLTWSEPISYRRPAEWAGTVTH